MLGALRFVAGLDSRVRDLYRVRRIRREEPRKMKLAFPDLALRSGTLTDILAEYREDYESYVRTVSSARAAASLSAVALSAWVIRNYPVKRVVDLGSGFSSYVMRREALAKDVAHIAVDDNADWLEKTRQFLREHKLPDSDVCEWKDFSRHDHSGAFDFVFHDLGGSTTRIIALPVVQDILSPRGLLLLDDMHKPHYRPHALQFFNSTSWNIVDVPSLTGDSFGRFSALGRRGSPGTSQG